MKLTVIVSVSFHLSVRVSVDSSESVSTRAKHVLSQRTHEWHVSQTHLPYNSITPTFLPAKIADQRKTTRNRPERSQERTDWRGVKIREGDRKRGKKRRGATEKGDTILWSGDVHALSDASHARSCFFLLFSLWAVSSFLYLFFLFIHLTDTDTHI